MAERVLLVNFVYCPPVGHCIEALHYCNEYHLADPELRIAVALHHDTPFELARLCPYISDVYPVTLDVFDGTTPANWLEGSEPLDRAPLAV